MSAFVPCLAFELEFTHSSFVVLPKQGVPSFVLNLIEEGRRIGLVERNQDISDLRLLQLEIDGPWFSAFGL